MFWPAAEPEPPVHHLRPAAPAAHQRGDLRLRRQRHVHGHLLLAAAALQGAHVQRRAELAQLLGLAGHHRAAAITLPLGFTTSKEYAELEWPIDIAIAVVWVVFTVNLFGTILKRREQHMYVAIWFYIATALTVAVLHIVNSMEMPASAVQELLDVRRRAGRAGAMVVRPQRGGVLPDHALPRA